MNDQSSPDRPPHLTIEELIAFERDIANEFNNGRIKAPIHLEGNNESQLIEIFKDVRRTDWVCCSWRSHYKALLHGIPPAEVKAAIMEGHSITLCFPEYRFISSAIVGGILPVAAGIAWAIRRAGKDERVFAFAGDMTALGGMFHECLQYARGHELPISFIVEDNGLSVCSDTKATWGGQLNRAEPVQYYRYVLPYPHSGAGKRVEF
jgi:TPP-dependent pyruvate/acetoin dehydrogenase alpha subunit